MSNAERKYKKFLVDENDSSEKAIEKVNKLLDELAKNYEAAGKQLFKARQARLKVTAGNTILRQGKPKKRKQTNKKSCLRTSSTGSKRNMMKNCKTLKRLKKKRKIRGNKSLKNFKKELSLSKGNTRKLEKSRFKNSDKTKRKL